MTENRIIVTAWAVTSLCFVLAGACDLGALVFRISSLAEASFWFMGVGLIAAFILTPVFPAREALARLVPIGFFAAAWMMRRPDIDSPSTAALVLAAFGIISLATVSTAYSSWLRAHQAPKIA